MPISRKSERVTKNNPAGQERANNPVDDKIAETVKSIRNLYDLKGKNKRRKGQHTGVQMLF